MPIYEYECKFCGYCMEAMQRISDEALTQCPSCGAEALTKLVSAAGFRLKGTGWYVTDFRDKNNAKKPEPKSGDGAKADGESKTSAEAKTESTATSAKSSESSSTSAPAANTTKTD